MSCSVAYTYTNVRELRIFQVEDLYNKATTGELLDQKLASEQHEFSCMRYSTNFKKKLKIIWTPLTPRSFFY